MDNAVHDEDLLIRYLDGELNDLQKKDVEQRLLTDTIFREQYQNLLVAVQAVKHLGTTQQVANIHREMMQELKSVPPRGSAFSLTKVVRYSMAVAASILVLFIGVRLYLNAQVSPDKIYDQTFVDFNVANTRSLDNKPSSIETAYQQGNFDAVINAVHTFNLSSKDSLLIGLSYLHQNKLSSAVNWLEKLTEAKGEYSQDAEFYLSLAYLKDKAYEKSLSIMKQIHNNSLHIYHEQVSDETVEKLQKLVR